MWLIKTKIGSVDVGKCKFCQDVALDNSQFCSVYCATLFEELEGKLL